MYKMVKKRKTREKKKERKTRERYLPTSDKNIKIERENIAFKKEWNAKKIITKCVK